MKPLKGKKTLGSKLRVPTHYSCKNFMEKRKERMKEGRKQVKLVVVKERP